MCVPARAPALQLSRLVRLSGKGNAEALVPWADFLNHSPQVRYGAASDHSPAVCVCVSCGVV